MALNNYYSMQIIQDYHLIILKDQKYINLKITIDVNVTAPRQICKLGVPRFQYWGPLNL